MTTMTLVYRRLKRSELDNTREEGKGTAADISLGMAMERFREQKVLWKEREG